ncbi:MAG TPA: hypothetical protein VGT79_03555 [Xanthomonadaceae bacterium]|nr:hypothetical protein [Xanthomonadaceae bacterium]
MRSLIAALLLLFAFVALPARAAGMNRCVGPDGHSVFTDQHCEDVGAVVRPEPAPIFGSASTQRVHVHVHDCARTADELHNGLEAALAAHDVNRIAGFYQWAGISSAESADILKRLQAIADRPLAEVHLVRRHAPTDANGYQTVASARPSEAIAIELVQTRSGNNPTPAHTEFALTAYMGCWWIRF